MKHRTRLGLLLLTAVLSFPVVAQSPPAEGAPAETDAVQALVIQHLTEGSRLVKSGKPAEAITEHLDKAIDAFKLRYKDEKRRIYAARSPAESLMYMLEAAASKDEPKTGAIVVSALWGDALYLKGYALMELGRLDEARATLDEAVSLSPQHAQYLSELGAVYIAQRNLPMAFTQYEKAEAAAKGFSPPHAKTVELSRAMRGKAYILIEQGKLDDAEKIYRECLVLDPNDMRARSQMDYIDAVRKRQKAAAPAPAPA